MNTTDQKLNDKIHDYNKRINKALSEDNFVLATELSNERDQMFIEYLYNKDKKAQEG
tara:strand:- start:901 stop:1071 length:171 start_codon:yes stop_codon:yes gene_type:complete